MLKAKIRLTREDGLHARPAALLVSLALRYPRLDITLEKNGKEVNGKSLTAILTLQGEMGDVIGFKISGEGEEEFWKELTQTIQGEVVQFEKG
ncbi:MAG: HPr family phosphocarrier protein [bacterium]